MRPTELKQAVQHLTANRSPVMIWGPPGVGKSDIVESIAKEQKIGLIDFRLALRDPTDIKGFPMPDAKTGTMKFMRDGELPTKGKGILFLDEINGAAPATQAAAMQLTLTGKIGDYTLPAGWSIVAAGNRESDRSAVNRMPSALSLRLRHLDLDVHLDDWSTWALKNDVPTELIAFMRFKPALLHSFNPAERSSPNPRSWNFLSQDIKANLPQNIMFDIAKGTVGEGAASEFMAFLQVYRELPSVDSILLNPEKAEVPKEPSVMYALTGALTATVKEASIERAMKFISRIPMEYQAVVMRNFKDSCPAIYQTKSFIDWTIKNSNLLN